MPNDRSYTPRLVDTLVLAEATARSWGHNFVGLDHVLYALMGLEEGAAFEALGMPRVERERVRSRVMALYVPATLDPARTDDFDDFGNEVTPRLRTVMDDLGNEMRLPTKLNVAFDAVGPELD